MEKRIVAITILGYFGLFLILFAGLGYYRHQQIPPEQPIAFSHRTHVAKVALQCDLCHNYAAKSISAGVPSVQKCMDCHIVAAADNPEIKKLQRYWENKEPIAWVRIYSLKDFVYFSHKRHVLKKIDCSECHGEVKVMDSVRQVRSLNMGWCVSCHKAKSAPIDCLTCHK